MPRDDMNFRLAIDAGVKHLQGGQLRKAEEQFRFAIRRCVDCGAGYRGLAKVLVELEDRTKALETLRDGAQTLARSGNRVEAIELLRDAVRLDAADLASHRRLAAALANAGDESGAAAEYARFVEAVLRQGNEARARLELSYARSSLGDATALEWLESRFPAGAGVSAPSAPTPPPAPAAASVATMSAPPPDVPTDPRERALFLEARAQTLLARGDPGAAAAGVEAASALVAAGLAAAASDLLLQVIGTGSSDREVQRLLAEIASAQGRGDLAQQKRSLILDAARLDAAPPSRTGS